MTSEERKALNQDSETVIETYLKKMSTDQKKLAEAVLLGMTLASTKGASA